jgi:hypothetical protein
VVYWVLTPCIRVAYVVTDVSKEHITSVFLMYPEGGGDRFLRNVGKNLQEYTASKPRKQQFRF